MIKKLGEENARSTSDLWDDEVDGLPPEPSQLAPFGFAFARLWVAMGAGVYLALILVFAALLVLGRGTAEDSEFHDNLWAVNQNAQRLGGGVSNGRRAFRRHVGAWFHGKEITDLDMPKIVSIIRDCQSRRLGGAHLGLDLSRTSIGDDGIKLLHSVAGLELVSLRDSNVTKAGVDSLRKSLPQTHVDAWPICPAPPAETRRARRQDP